MVLQKIFENSEKSLSMCFPDTVVLNIFRWSGVAQWLDHNIWDPKVLCITTDHHIIYTLLQFHEI